MILIIFLVGFALTLGAILYIIWTCYQHEKERQEDED